MAKRTREDQGIVYRGNSPVVILTLTLPADTLPIASPHWALPIVWLCPTRSAMTARWIWRRRPGAEVIQRTFDNFAGQRNAAMEAVVADWIFFVDADERIPP